MSVVVGLRDGVARCFSDIQVLRNDEVASRGFVNTFLAARSGSPQLKGSLFDTNPEDLSLWHLADFDEVNGVFEPQDHYVIISGLDVLSSFDKKVPDADFDFMVGDVDD